MKKIIAMLLVLVMLFALSAAAMADESPAEGESTEERYFRELINGIERLDLSPLVDIRLWQKTGKDKGRSDPRALIEFAHAQKSQSDLSYNKTHDRMVIVFDADKYCKRVSRHHPSSRRRAA